MRKSSFPWRPTVLGTLLGCGVGGVLGGFAWRSGGLCAVGALLAVFALAELEHLGDE